MSLKFSRDRERAHERGCDTKDFGMDLPAGCDKEQMTESELQEAILEHAKFLGMDPVLDAAFLWIAEESLTAPLPEGWQQAEADDGTLYHFNPDTGESLWEHPLDEVYRQKFRDREEKAKAPTREEIQEIFVRAGMSDRTARMAMEKVFTFDGVDWTESDLAQAVTHEEGAHFFLRVLEMLEIPGVDNIHVKRGILTDKFWKAETLVALHSFNGEKEHDLSFQKGELLFGELLADDGGWWIGRNEAGEKGVFPATFVVQAGSKPTAQQMVDVNGETLTPLVALYNFDKKEATDLSFKKGELLIGHELEGEWWVGSNEAGETGVFPVNFVKRRDKTLTAAAAVASPEDGRRLLLSAIQ